MTPQEEERSIEVSLWAKKSPLEKEFLMFEYLQNCDDHMNRIEEVLEYINGNLASIAVSLEKIAGKI